MRTPECSLMPFSEKQPRKAFADVKPPSEIAPIQISTSRKAHGLTSIVENALLLPIIHLNAPSRTLADRRIVAAWQV